MRIGIFTDTYRPSLNGIVYVTEILRRNFENLGHEVFVFCPSSGLSNKSDQNDRHIITFPALSGVVYDDFNTSLFFPPKVLKQIEELKLDVIHFLTPGPVGFMGMYAAGKLKIPLVAEYCTDLFEYVEHYPTSLPSILAMGVVLPFTFKASRDEFLDMVKAARPRLGATKWNREMVKHLITVMHSHCDAVIAHSRKSAQQLESWQNGDDHYHIDIIPTGVDPLPKTSIKDLAVFKKRWQIKASDEVVTYAGRLSPEKNLAMLIDMINELVKWRPNAKLMYVGDFAEYRPKLEELAKKSPAHSRIIFTGRLPREELGRAYCTSQVFVFPSLTDTQGLVLHEAALAGLPLVVVDGPVTEVLQDGKNGYVCKDDPIDMANKVCMILEDDKLHKKMSVASQKIASEFSELKQSKKILKIYAGIIRSKTIAPTAPRK